MIDYHPVRIVELGPLNIKVWGAMFALAVIAGLIWSYYRAEEKEKDHILNIAIVAIIGGIIGSRLAYIILYSETIVDIWQVFKIWQGGMVSYGGFVIGGFLSLVYLKAQKLNIYRYLDLFAPPLALSIAITRVGCFLNHCHLGEETNLPWALDYLAETRHPVALYYVISALIIMIILLIVERRTSKTGLTGLSLLVLYPVFRLIIDQFAFYQPNYIGLVNNVFLAIVLVFALYLLTNRLKQSTS